MDEVVKLKYLGSMFIANGQGPEKVRGRNNLMFCILWHAVMYLAVT